MKLRCIRNCGFALMLVVASVAQADSQLPSPDQHSPRHQWTPADKDQDGQLSREELSPFPAFMQDFDAIDSNDDGRITRSEYASWRNAQKF